MPRSDQAGRGHRVQPLAQLRGQHLRGKRRVERADLPARAELRRGRHPARRHAEPGLGLTAGDPQLGEPAGESDHPTQPDQCSELYSITWNDLPELVRPMIWSSGRRWKPIPNGGLPSLATASNVGLFTNVQPRSRSDLMYCCRRTNATTPQMIPAAPSNMTINTTIATPSTSTS
jgi:hypothetical protein